MRYAKLVVLFLAVFCLALQAQETVKTTTLACGEALVVPSHQSVYPVQAGENSLRAIGLEKFLVGIAVDENCQKIGLEGFTKYNKVAFYIPLTGSKQDVKVLKAQYRAMYAAPVVTPTPAPQAPAVSTPKPIVASNTSSSATVVVSSTPAAPVVKYVTDPTLLGELNKAQSRVRELQQQLDTARKTPPAPASAPAKGESKELLALRKQAEESSKALSAEKKKAENLSDQLKAAQESARTMQEGWDKERQQFAARVNGLEKTLKTQQELASRQPGSRVGESIKTGKAFIQEGGEIAQLKTKLELMDTELQQALGWQEAYKKLDEKFQKYRNKYEPEKVEYSGFEKTWAKLTKNIYWDETVYELVNPPREYRDKLAEYRKGKVVKEITPPKKSKLAAEILSKPDSQLTPEQLFLKQKHRKEEQPEKVYAYLDYNAEQQCLESYVTRKNLVGDPGNAIACADLTLILNKHQGQFSHMTERVRRYNKKLPVGFLIVVIVAIPLAILYWSQISQFVRRLSGRLVLKLKKRWILRSFEQLRSQLPAVSESSSAKRSPASREPGHRNSALSEWGARRPAKREDFPEGKPSVQNEEHTLHLLPRVPDSDVKHSEAV